MENIEPRAEADRVRDAVQEMAVLLDKHFSGDPGLAMTSLVYFIIRISTAMGVPSESVVQGITEGFAIQELMDKEVDSKWVN